ncbi:PIN domain nuclease [Candidatus Pacearchaeota archaeon CG10_big_fil_rev_8_21_14_0_10_35_13]|nr:MAG: PIN domain nuclease [Candidatus Pacearchaeota archaeon CG10_big_fil_rev_8_21_14_0_10_35_13]
MICLDSDCIIDFLKGKEEAVMIVKKYEDEIFTTEINVFEVLLGVYLRDNYEKEELVIKNFFGNIKKFSFDNQCGELSAKILADLIRGGKEINQNDCLIASIILKNGSHRIITRNEKHYSKIKGLKVIKY